MTPPVHELVRPSRDPGSFRDPSGSVFHHDSRVFRAIYPPGLPAYRDAADSGIYRISEDAGFLLGLRELEEAERKSLGLQIADAPVVVEHPVVPFVSYAYEWSFPQLKAAALLQLDFQLHLLEHGFTLSDASSYNVQFVGSRPVFIDHLSIVRHHEGEVWAGHSQFCAHYLNPLLLWACRGVSPAAWLRGNLEGIAPEALDPLLRLRDKCSPTIFLHVVMQAKVQRKLIGKNDDLNEIPERRAHLPLRSLVGMLKGLRDRISRLASPTDRTVWSDYAENNSYSDSDAEQKRRFVADLVSTTRPSVLLDIGCNSGAYSQHALEHGAMSVVAVDTDEGAVEAAHRRFSKLPEKQRALALLVDIVNPSPAQGFAGRERPSFPERGAFDALLALAVIHHMVIGRNLPLDDAVACLIDLAPTGIIEFPAKGDPMVQVLLRNRADIFPDYDEDSFLTAVRERARIVESLRLANGERLLIRYQRGNA